MLRNKSVEEYIDRVAELISDARNIGVFTGAGISTESGIPDFRSEDGLWNRYNPEEFTYDKFLASPEVRRKQWVVLREGSLTREAKPNDAHYAIAELHRRGKLDCVITQNIDGLHQKSGVPDEKVFELHGNMKRAVCLKCGRRYTIEQVKQKLANGEDAPMCDECRDILKPDVVLFGEALPVKTLEEAARRAQTCDLFMVIGSSLVVYPAAYIPNYARQAAATIVVINLTPTYIDDFAEVVISEKAGETMNKVIQKVL